MKTISAEVWEKYLSILADPQNDPDGPPLPIGMGRSRFQAKFDYVPPESFLSALRRWVIEGSDHFAYYFLTEGFEGEEYFFKLAPDDLTRDVLTEVNSGVQNLIVAPDFSWAVFFEHTGEVYLAGSEEFRERLGRAVAESASEA